MVEHVNLHLQYAGIDISLDNFTKPYTYVPFEVNVSGQYIEHYDKYQNFFMKSSPCLIYDTISGDFCADSPSNDMSYNSEDSTCTSLPYTASISGEDTTSGSDDVTDSEACDLGSKCIADNGAEVGDPVCCEQTGVVKDTKYNCPADYPTCVGYKCGESWGKCQ